MKMLVLGHLLHTTVLRTYEKREARNASFLAGHPVHIYTLSSLVFSLVLRLILLCSFSCSSLLLLFSDPSFVLPPSFWLGCAGL